MGITFLKILYNITSEIAWTSGTACHCICMCCFNRGNVNKNKFKKTLEVGGWVKCQIGN